MFVSRFLPKCKATDIDGLLGMINGLGQNEMWNDISPIWARPQNGYLELYPEDYLQVVGHTPMPKTDFFVNCLTVDNFGTSILGNAKGNQRFVWVDTNKKQWGFVDRKGEIDVECDHVLYKHVPIEDVIELSKTNHKFIQS